MSIGITISFAVLFFVLLLTAAQAACTATIVGGSTFGTLQAAIDAAATGATIQVVGDCNENASVTERKERITLDGLGSASISGFSATQAVVSVRGRGTTIRRFTISGGENGIQVWRGGTATIELNVIQGTGGTGIVVNQGSYALIVNNTIRNNLGNGITINENSSARIGFVGGGDTVASPNLIENNGGRGITVTRASNARIVGNTIRDHVDDGIAVTRNSHAAASMNTIDSNDGDAIFLSTNSGINLGSDSGATIFDTPNSTNSPAANNGGFGVRCTQNSYADGRLGSLNGVGGPSSFAGNCVNDLVP